MKAAFITGHGGNEVVAVADRPMPQRAPGEVLVRGGRIVTCGATTGDQPPADLRRIFIRQLQIFGSTLGDLHEMTDLLSAVRCGAAAFGR